MLMPKIVMLSAIVKPDLSRSRSTGIGPPIGIKTLFSRLVFSPLSEAKSERIHLIESSAS